MLFDFAQVATYYTRPMSPAWSKPLDIERLADAGAEVGFTVPLAQLPRLTGTFPDITGSASGSARFAREQGLLVAEVSVQGSARLVCQRCMGPLELPLRSEVRVALVTEEGEAARVPEDLEPMLAPGGRVTAGELVEEELLLALPIVPMHASGQPCAAEEVQAAEPERPASQKPFERLNELLKRN